MIFEIRELRYIFVGNCVFLHYLRLLKGCSTSDDLYCCLSSFGMCLHMRHKKFDYTAMWTDLRRSVGVTTATKLVCLTGLRAHPSHSVLSTDKQKYQKGKVKKQTTPYYSSIIIVDVKNKSDIYFYCSRYTYRYRCIFKIGNKILDIKFEVY